MTVSLHIDPEHEYGFTVTLNGKASHFTELPPPQAERHFPELRSVDAALLPVLTSLTWAANSGAITGEQFFAAGQALGLSHYYFQPPTDQPYTFTYNDETFTVVATDSHAAIDEANAHFGLPENFAHWCYNAVDSDSTRAFTA